MTSPAFLADQAMVVITDLSKLQIFHVTLWQAGPQHPECARVYSAFCTCLDSQLARILGVKHAVDVEEQEGLFVSSRRQYS